MLQWRDSLVADCSSGVDSVEVEDRCGLEAVRKLGWSEA